MDKEKLVVEIRSSLNKFISEHFIINMAMLIKDLDSDTYTFLISSKFMDLLNYYDSLKLVAGFFYNDLSEEAFSIISRINIISTSDPSINLIYETFDVTGNIAYFKDCKFFNVTIEDLIILESHK